MSLIQISLSYTSLPNGNLKRVFTDFRYVKMVVRAAPPAINFLS